MDKSTVFGILIVSAVSLGLLYTIMGDELGIKDWLGVLQ